VALELFLRNVPAQSGIAFVVVQHLSPTHTSNLPELLQRCTEMKVSQVNGSTAVQPDRVYVIPPNMDITISKRTLHLKRCEIDVKRGHVARNDAGFFQGCSSGSEGAAAKTGDATGQQTDCGT